MILIHEKASRGTSRTGWLDSRHTFSFGGFKDPTRMGFGNLRVLNEDHIIPGSGFAPHRHESMDILTMVLSGRLRHEDDQGNVQTIGPGEVQLMSAGDGITHAEWNASDAEPAHFLQIWMIPDRPGGAAHYAQARLPDQRGDLLLAAAPGKGGLLPLRSSSAVTLLRGTEGGTRQIGSDSGQVFVQMVRGLADVDGERISAGDGLQIPAGETARLLWQTEGEALLFDMPIGGAQNPAALHH